MPKRLSVFALLVVAVSILPSCQPGVVYVTGYTFPQGSKAGGEEWTKIAWVRQKTRQSGGFSQHGERTVEISIEYRSLDKTQVFAMDFDGKVQLDTAGTWLDEHHFELTILGTTEHDEAELLPISATIQVRAD